MDWQKTRTAACCLLILMFGAGCFEAGSGTSPQPAGKPPKCTEPGTESVLVIEAGLRMYGPALAAPQGGKNPTKWELVREAAKRASQYMKAETRAILSFPADEASDCGEYGCDFDWKAWYHDRSVFKDGDWYWKGGREVGVGCNVADPQIGFGEVPGQYVSGLEHIGVGGDAPVADALMSAFNAFAPRPVEGASRHIFLVADGADTCGGDAARMVKKLHARGIDVWVIGFETSDVEALNTLAELGGHPQPGERKFFVLDSVDDFADTVRLALGEVAAEVCDGVDNDCNGLVDDGLNRACALPCGGGVQSCEKGAWGACEPVPSPWIAEHCDGKDDNCDGDVDETFGLGAACVAEQGACRSFGHVVCAPDGASAVCDAPAVVLGAEVCNGVDDDCDGQVDEGISVECETACGRGHQGCIAGVPGACAIEIPNSELCNGLDDDCDGQVDEGFVLGTPCSVGSGFCQVTGVTVCSADGLEAVCNVAPDGTGSEVCNGEDDDCDGLTDEGDLCPKGQICYLGQCIYD